MKVLFTTKWRSLFVISFFTVLTATMMTGCKPLAKENKTELKTYTVTVTPPANGTISVKKGGAVLTSEALKAVEENTELEITLTVKSGYKAVKLVIDGVAETHSKDGGKTISKKVKLTKAITVSGEVTQENTPPKTYTVTVTPPANGTITVKKGGAVLTSEALKAVEENTELVITLTANDGYKTAKLVIDGVAETHSKDGGKTISKKVKLTKAITVSGEVVKKNSDAGKSFTVNDVSFNMKRIPRAENITLGNTYNNSEIPDNKVRKISLSEYFIGETEVTQNLYNAVTGKNPSHFRDNPAQGEMQGMRPVEQISWYEALAFCNELTKKINGNDDLCVYYADLQLKTVYTYTHAEQEKFPYIDRDKAGFRLPTEAEWEYAARGGKDFRYAGTDNISELKNFAWYDTSAGGNADDKTHQVAKKNPNSYGIYDMSGNVMELCWDFHHDELPENETDPHGNPNHSPNKIVRGGSWRWNALTCEVAYRDITEPIGKSPAMGLRLAYGVSAKSTAPFIPKEKLTVNFSVEGAKGGLITAQEGINGIIHTASPIEVKPGTMVIFHAKPDLGYAVESWKGLKASPVDSLAPHKTIYSDSQISVKFKKISSNDQSLVTVIQPDNGKITIKKDGNLIEGEDLKKITKGTELEISLIADQGCTAKSLTVGSNTITESKDGGKTISTKFTVNNNITVSGVVEYETVEVHFSVEGGQGGSLEIELIGSTTVYKNSPAKIRKGAMVGFNAKPAAGYEVESWKGITVSPPNSKYTQHNITKTITVSVKFKSGIKKHLLNYRVEGEGGKLEAEQNFKPISSGSYIEKGKTVTLYAEPSTGFEVESWSGAGNIPSANAPIVKIIMDRDYNIVVKFKKKDGNTNETEKFEVKFSVESSSGSGTLTAKTEDTGALTPSIVSGSLVPKDTIIVFTATPAPDSKLERWIGITPIPENSLTAKLKITKPEEIKVQFKKNEESANNTPLEKVFTVETVTFKMYGIAADQAELGNSAKLDNKPHTVNLSAYSIGETEVTQGLYKAVMNVNPSYLNGDGSSSPEKATPSGEDQEKRPVESVDWYDAVLFCNELTKKINGNSVEECVYYSDAAFQHVYTNENANKKDLPYMNIAKKGFRLPTEAEWEWAAKGGKNNIWAGTDDEDALQEYAWYMDPNNLSFDPLAFVTHQTAIKKENGYKLFDMSGNVSEWCWDWYDKDYCNNLPTNAANPVGVDTGKYRVIRGGDFFAPPKECECSNRKERDPKRKDNIVGFRLACSM